MHWTKWVRVFTLNNINVPQEILDIEAQIEEINVQKNNVVKQSKYEEAAILRDEERKLQEKLEGR